MKWLAGTLWEEGWTSFEVGVIAHVIHEKNISLQTIAIIEITLFNNNKLNKITDVPVLFNPFSLLDKHCMLTVYVSSPHYVFNSITHMDTFYLLLLISFMANSIFL